MSQEKMPTPVTAPSKEGSSEKPEKTVMEHYKDFARTDLEKIGEFSEEEIKNVEDVLPFLKPTFILDIGHGYGIHRDKMGFKLAPLKTFPAPDLNRDFNPILTITELQVKDELIFRDSKVDQKPKSAGKDITLERKPDGTWK